MSTLASDDDLQEPGAPGQADPKRDTGNLPEAAQSGANAPDSTPWLEPRVQSLAMFTELFRSGDRTEAEMEQMLTRHTTTMAWTDFWAREGYITEVVRGSERRFTLSGKAALLLELP